MMPSCYHSRRFLFWRFYCPNVADHVEVVGDGEQVAACDNHHRWFLQEIAKKDQEANRNG